MTRRSNLRLVRWIAAAVVGALVVAVAARLTFPLPGTDLPQSAQTLAVLLVAAALGAGRGAASMGVYLLAGAAGLPVFADGAHGIETLLGPSAGYLVGFVVAAAWVGWWADRRRITWSWWRGVLVMVGAHASILLLGGVGLIPRVGLAQAWSAGVAPFVVGGAVKSGLATAGVYLVRDRLPLGSTTGTSSGSGSTRRR